MPDIDIKSDLMVGVMNLIEMENHARFNFLITNDEKWLNILNEARVTRSKQMKDLEKEEESQLHCFNKHTLSFVFRSFEVGDKFLSEGNKEKAKEYYNDAYLWIEKFYLLNFQDQEKNKKEGFFERIKNNLK